MKFKAKINKISYRVVLAQAYKADWISKTACV